MSKNKDPEKDNDKNIIINKINKKNIKNVLDPSKSSLSTNWYVNPDKNNEKHPLQTCRDKIFGPPLTTPNTLTKTNLNKFNNEFNMTINKILDSMKQNRRNNQKVSDMKKEGILPTKLDNDKSLDLSNNQLVTYKPDEDDKKSLDKFLAALNEKSNNLEKNSSFFNYYSSKNVKSRHRRRTKSYYPPPLQDRYLLSPPPPPPVPKTKVNIQVEIEGIDDLLKLIDDYPLKYDVEYNINMLAIHNIKAPLLDLKKMIGMHKLKNSIVDQILYFIQDFHKNSNAKIPDFMHTVIYGPPGTGKTETAKIIGNIFSKLGVLSRNYFKKATRADFIAGYLGQTALKTRDIIKECLGGVLFIDEAYSLGNPEKRDSFAKECIDTLCESLSDNKDDLMVIIAGYEKELKECFFAYNQGLESRFTWRFNTNDYSYEELFLIFCKKIDDIGWSMHKDIKQSWFKNKMDKFTFFGRDIETLLAKVKIAHGRRVFCLPIIEKTKINLKDLNNGFKSFLDNNDKNRNNNTSKYILNHMYC